MAYSNLLSYTRDIAANLTVANKFFHGRKEVLHEYNPTDNVITIWSLLFSTSGSLTEDAYQVNRQFTINLIIYQDDMMGSEIDQNDQDNTSPEILVVEQTDAVAAEFLRLFNFNDINDTLQSASEKLIIDNFTTEPVIKDNDYLLTGTLLSMSVTVPDEFDYCTIV